MCLFKRKKKEPEIQIDSEYKVGEIIKFKYRDDLAVGHVYRVKLDENNHIVYDIQLGGECPSFVYKVDSDKVVHKRK